MQENRKARGAIYISSPRRQDFQKRRAGRFEDTVEAKAGWIDLLKLATYTKYL